VIELVVGELTPLMGTRPACQALGVAPATIYRRRRPPQPRPRKPRPQPARALSPVEREAVLEALHAERFVDRSPAQVWATLLDEGRYLASERTMYRILAEKGESRERRDQLVLRLGSAFASDSDVAISADGRRIVYVARGWGSAAALHAHPGGARGEAARGDRRREGAFLLSGQPLDRLLRRRTRAP